MHHRDSRQSLSVAMGSLTLNSPGASEPVLLVLASGWVHNEKSTSARPLASSRRPAVNFLAGPRAPVRERDHQERLEHTLNVYGLIRGEREARRIAANIAKPPELLNASLYALTSVRALAIP